MTKAPEMTSRQVKRVLADLKFEIDEVLVAAEPNPSERDPARDICAYAIREVDRLMHDAGRGADIDGLCAGLMALRRDLDRRFGMMN